MHIAAVCSRLRLSFADPAMRAKVHALMDEQGHRA